MVSETERLIDGLGLPRVVRVIAGVTLVLALLAAAGCSGASEPAPTKEKADTRKGYGMGGVEQDIAVPSEVLNNKPAPPDLTTPESAVRSYVDWVTYAYRTSLVEEATPTMSPYQVVRVDAYNQHNLQEEQLIEQKLDSFVLGKPVVQKDRALVPAKEEWTYSYVSLRPKTPGKTLKGPYDASYETTYVLVKNDTGGWVVDNIEVKTLGEVK